MRARVVIAMLGLMPAVVLAQHKPGQTGRVAGIAWPPGPVVSPVTVPPPGQFLYGSIPVLVSPDGRVFADFGGGYEQLVRNCATPYANYQPATQPSAGMQPAVVQPSPLPYTQPVPNQPTASQQMATQQQQQVATLPRATTLNSQSCWSADRSGRVMVGR